MVVTREQARNGRGDGVANGVTNNDTEITLGMSKLLGLFFGLVLLCGISLAVGYSLGRNSAKQAAAAAAVAPAAAAIPAAQTIDKPPASTASSPRTPDCATGDNCPPPAGAAASTTDLTFYQAVQQKDSHPQLTPPATAAPLPPRPTEAASTLGTGYLVQIAAVRNQADAKLLSDALQKQHYPVLIAQPGDKLFHVQVGPYADIKEAEAMRSRLVSSGYNAFLKR
jgi:cell division septation protein DedD